MKLFGILVAVLIVFSIAGSASAKPFKHCDGNKWRISERMPIDMDETISDGCFKLKPLKEKKLKKKKSNGLESCDFRSIFKEDCGEPKLRVCQTRTSSDPVPEPASLLLFGAGLAGLGVFVKKFKKT